MSDLYRNYSRGNHHHEFNSSAMAIFRACKYGNLKFLKELVASGSDVNERTPTDRETPLIVAAKYGNLPVVDFLIKMGAHVNYVDSQGRTALMVACRLGEFKCAKALLRSWQADIDKMDNGGNTALILTASHLSSPEHVVCIELLLAEDADVNLKNNIGMTAAMYSAKNATIGWEGVKLLLDAGADPEALNDVSENLLMQAACQGHHEIMQWLMDIGVNDVELTNCFGDNALILALKHGNAKCIDMLLHRGSDPNSISGQGCHALSIAASVSFENTLLLLTFGAVPQPSKLYVRHDLLVCLTDDERTAFMHCPDFFQPTDIAVLHRNFTVANLLSRVSSCYPSYHLYSILNSKPLSEHTRTVLDFISEAAASCPEWIIESSEFSPGPSTLMFLSQQVVSSMAGFSRKRHERLNSFGLPPKLVRNILLEGFKEEMFVFSVEDVD